MVGSLTAGAEASTPSEVRVTRTGAAWSRARILFASPLPPPPGGIATWMRTTLESPLAEMFELEVLDTALSCKAIVPNRSRFRVGRAWHAVALLLRCVRVLWRFRPHIVHVNTSYYWAFARDGLLVWTASLLGTRTVLHFCGGDFPSFATSCPRLIRLAIDATLRRSDRLIALTRETEAFLRARVGPERVCYIPNFVPLQDFGALVDRSQRHEHPVEILFVGWILEAKGVSELLAAARVLTETRFTLVGPSDPTFIAAIREDVAALGDRVRLLGPRPREAILALYAQADIFALPTYREGFPLALLEAMAAGLPSVTTSVGAIPDAIRDGEEGLVVLPGDTIGLTTALRVLVENPERRWEMGRRARRRAEHLFALEKVVRQLEKLYRELLPTDV